MKVAPVSGDLLVRAAIGAALVAVAWVAMRNLSSAISGTAAGLWEPLDNALTGAGQAISNAGAAVMDTAQRAVDATGGQAYTNASAYTLPDGYRADWWAGGAVMPIAPTQSYQADVRRIDNAIDAGSSWTDFFTPIRFDLT